MNTFFLGLYFLSLFLAITIWYFQLLPSPQNYSESFIQGKHLCCSIRKSLLLRSCFTCKMVKEEAAVSKLHVPKLASFQCFWSLYLYSSTLLFSSWTANRIDIARNLKACSVLPSFSSSVFIINPNYSLLLSTYGFSDCPVSAKFKNVLANST